MFQTKVVEKIKTHILCSVTFFSKNRAVCEVMWKNIVEQDRPQMAMRRMRIACYVPKATDTHSECVTLIAFPLKQWLRERASMFRYTYIACLVLTDILVVFHSHIISKPTLFQKLDFFYQST